MTYEIKMQSTFILVVKHILINTEIVFINYTHLVNPHHKKWGNTYYGLEC